MYGFGYTRAAIEPYLEFIPDPEKEPWNPCNEPSRHSESEVQQYLSCLAKNGSMYVVANVGDIQPCNQTSDSDCPSDDHYQYNTNVVYDKTGTLVARYHKQNLFFEYQFDTPKTVEHIYFDTPFGRFGVFTCFDILFKEPAITLVTKYNVTNVAFPTAWMDALPHLAAIQFHSAFAAGLGINLLGANIHLPVKRFHGSGIYTPTGAVSYYYNDKNSAGKLLISEVKSIRETLIIPHQDSISRPDLSTEDKQFNSSVFHDFFTFVPINPNMKNRNESVCQNSLCCYLEYEFLESVNNEHFAFGVFDGLHTYEGTYYLQICALFKCVSEQTSCGIAMKQSSTKFKTINIRGTFQTDFIFPEVLLVNNDSLALASREDWHFENTKMSFFGNENPVLSAVLFGRVYEKDSYIEPLTGSSPSYAGLTFNRIVPVILNVCYALRPIYI